ncbi:four helix bundle protein [candidate division WOR-3 bacterium]|nr:four helix bundle protein [candidate division WOR-3 bacterium]
MEKKIQYFTDLIAWKVSHQLFLDALKDIKHFPKSIEGRILAAQLIRAIGSIGANIAEGFNSRTTKQYINYLDISRNSSSEAENWYYKVRDAHWLERSIANQRSAYSNMHRNMQNAAKYDK